MPDAQPNNARCAERCAIPTRKRHGVCSEATTMTDPSQIQVHAEVAARLRAEKERVLRVWEQRVREGVPAAKHTETLALFDSMPELIDRLAAAIGTPAQESALKAQAHKPAADHGKQRADLIEYSLDQVIAEHEMLRVI